MAVVFDWAGTLAVSRSTVHTDIAFDAEKMITFNELYKRYKREATTTGLLDVTEVVTKAMDEAKIEDEETRAFLIKKYNTKGLAEETLVEKGFLVGLVRNSKLPSQLFYDDYCVPLGTSKFFSPQLNMILSSEVGGIEKPSTEIFEGLLNRYAALKKLHEANPKSIWMVGNEVQADVMGGKNMGWTTVLIRSTESTSGGLADHEVDSFAELEQLFFARN